jgi:hypothetical protein
LTILLAKSRSILNAPPQLQELSGAPENALGAPESTSLSFRRAWEHLGAPVRLTGVPGRFTYAFRTGLHFADVHLLALNPLLLPLSLIQPTPQLPGAIFLRGGSVAILLILEEEEGGEEWVVPTVQPRVPASSLEFVELPAGMLDDSSLTGAAAKEIQEECGIEIPADELLDLTQLALGKFVDGGEEKLQTAVYPSPGGECMRCCVGD